MKPAACIASVLASLLILGVVTGIVGIRYPRGIDNVVLLAPVKVSAVNGDLITLEDGRRVRAPHFLRDRGVEAGELVDVDERNPSMVSIYASRRRFICGTPWVALINIPLIADEIPRNQRELVLMGEFEESPQAEEP